MDMTGFMAGGAVLAVLTSCWGYVKAFAWRIISLFVQRVEINTEDVHFPVIWYLLDNYKMSPIYDKVYGGNFEYKVDGRFGLIPYEHFGKQMLVFWKKVWWIFKVPIVVARVGNAQATGQNDNRNNGGANNNNEHGVFSTITIMRWTVNLDQIITKACEHKNQLAWNVIDEYNGSTKRFFIKRVPEGTTEGQNANVEKNQLAWYQRRHFRLLNEDPNNLGRRNPSKKSSLEQLVFPQHVKDLINEIKLWRRSRTWYQERGVPWKRGWNLYGPPGTGKTALARAFAEDLDLPLFVFNLAEVTSNTEFIKEWKNMQSNVPCIALIEDIDNVFHGRENITTRRRFSSMLFEHSGNGNGKNNGNGKQNAEQGAEDGGGRWGLTFDCLLNCLDGVDRNEGVFLIITTNDLEKIDPALGQPRKDANGKIESISTRPGRIDKAIELTYLTTEDKYEMAKRIMGDYPEELAKIREYIKATPKELETPAQFQERCSQLALARYWKEISEEVEERNGHILHETQDPSILTFRSIQERYRDLEERDSMGALSDEEVEELRLYRATTVVPDDVPCIPADSYPQVDVESRWAPVVDDDVEFDPVAFDAQFKKMQ